MVNLPFLVSGDQILGSKVPVGTSNIHESSLPFDLSLFKSLHHIEVNICLSLVGFLANKNSDADHIKAPLVCREILGQ